MVTGQVRIAQAQEIATGLLGAAPEGMARYRPAVGGDDSHSFRFRLDGRRLLLKVKLAILVFKKLLFYKPETPRGAWAIATVKALLDR